MSNDKNENNKIRRRQVSSSSSRPNTNTNRTRPSTSRKKSNKKDKFKFLRVSGIVVLVLMVLGVAGATGLVFASLRDVQPVTKALLDQKTYQTTKIYYYNGDLLSNAPTVNKKEPISIDEMPQNLINAVVAIEDERFYEHNGVDIKGLLRSVVKTLTGNKQGGSTIPMQVSKMLLTTDKQTITRKIKDIYYAYEMSKNLIKNDILEVYLNNFFVCKVIAGVKACSHCYFSKDNPQDLTLAECALLAGSTKNPSRYSAYRTAKLDGSETKEELENRLLFFINTADDNLDDPTQVELDMIDKLNSWGLLPDNDTYKQLKAGTMVVRKAASNPDAITRRNVVLGKMLELGYITQTEYEEAKNEEINIKLPKDEDTVISSVEDLIEYEVIDALVAQGNTEDEAYNMFYNGGLQIHTTIDPNIQDTLEAEYENDSNFPNHSTSDGSIQPQSSMVILDYRTGHIKALVGGRHIKARKTLNRATIPQQPGSTIKPLSVYTPAIDTLKLTQASVFSDVRGGYKFKENNKWNPSTTTSGRGSMSLRKALAYSSNTIAAKVAETLGSSYEECIDIMIDYLRDFGISTIQADDNDRSFASLTLGGMSKGISPLEMSAAYGTLANGGIYIEPTIFTTINSYDGQLIVKNTPEEHKVIDADVAYVITDMLTAVVNQGTGGRANLSNGMPVAGKTGTTNKSLDAWFVGYTPYYVGATYIGDDARKDSNGNTIPRQSVSGGSSSAAKLWATVMNKVHKNLVATDGFKVPDNIYFTKINLIDGGKSASGTNAAFINGTGPSRYTSIAPEPVVTEPETENPELTEDNEGGNTNPQTPSTDGGGNTNPQTPSTDGGGNTDPQTPSTDGGGNVNPQTPSTDGSGTANPQTNTPE